MSGTPVYTLDLNFLGRPGTIAIYLIPHENGAVLVETGPGSTIQRVTDMLADHGYSPSDITNIFVTHIHLDHSGAAGWFSEQGAIIHVHPNGAQHLLNPEKLIASAKRIYGERMDPLWGEFLPVREERLHIMQDQEIIQIGDLSVKAVDVPGHANHHCAYFAGDICFSGDVGGIRVHGLKYLSVPMPPPDIHIEKWRESIKRMQAENPTRIAPTHFGIYDDAKWHLAELKRGLDMIESWMKNIMSLNLPIEALRERFVEFERQRAENAGLSSSDVEAQQIANPSYMSADGIQRYWQKYIAQNP